MSLSSNRAMPTLATIEQEASEERAEFVVRVQREHVRNVLVGADDDHCAPRTVHAARDEDVRTVLEVGAEGLLVVVDREATLAREQQRWQLVQLEIAVSLLKYRAKVYDAVDVRVF